MNPPLARYIRKLNAGDSVLPSIPIPTDTLLTNEEEDNDIMTPQATMLSGTAATANGGAAAALDLFILTFNCAKNLIDVPVFSAHLHGALRQNSSSLPDLVAFSLQEFAPLSYAFIGSYFLNPYYAKYEEALNLASAKFLDEQDSTADLDDDLSYAEGGAREEEEGLLKPVKKSQQQEQQQQNQPAKAKPYTLVRAKNVGMTAILLFARDPTTITRVEEAECGFGAADMGNKGAVGLRVSWRRDRDSRDETEVTLVATHLAAMEWNLKKRNANWKSIASGLTFANPKAALPGVFGANNDGPRADQSGAGDKGGPAAATADGSSSDSSELEEDESANQPLLNGEEGENLTPEHKTKLKDISVFKPSSYLFVAGDLNYRISSTTPPPLSTFPSFDPDSPNHYSTFFPRDQLTQERLAGRAFQGMSEAPISFGPTYKYNILQKPEGAVNEEAVRSGVERDGIPEVPWKFAPHRWPGWCDRVLYLDLPSWLKTKTRKVEVKAYNSLPVVKTSDHRAVFLRVQVPILGGEMMRKGLEMEENTNDEGVVKDPRVNPPVLVDVHAWERREAARRKELLVGLSAFVWSTQEGAILLATLMLVGATSWWATRGW